MITIRDYRSEDAPALWGVYFSAIRDTAAKDYSAEQIAAWAPESFDQALWAKRMAGIKPFVAERDGMVVGYAVVQEDGSDVSITARPFFEHWGFAVERQQSLVLTGISLTNYRMRKDQLTSKWSRRA